MRDLPGVSVGSSFLDARRSANLLLRVSLLALIGMLALAKTLTPGQALAWGVLCVSIRIFRPVSTLNLIAIYWFITFVIVPPAIIPMRAEQLCYHFALIQGVITAAYWIRRQFRSAARAAPPPPANPTIQARFKTFWYGAALVGIASIAVQVALAGLGAWFSGEVLAQQMEGYARGSLTEAVTRLLGWITNWTLLALLVFHKIYRVPMSPAASVIPWLGLPALALSRQILFYNTIFHAFTTRIRLTTIVIGVLVVGAAFYIGYLRASQLGITRDDPIGYLLAGEFSSCIPYSMLINYGDEIGYRWGVPIVIPVLLAIVPRFAFPDKPLNGSGVFMQHFEPGMLERGYTYAINPMSDAYLSFGMWGVVAVALLFGWIFSGVDRNLERGRMQVLDYLLIFNCYALMRFSLAAPITWIILQFALYWVLKKLILYSSTPRR